MITRKGVKAGTLLEIVLILAGLGLLAKAGMVGLDGYRFMNNADVIKTDGAIVAMDNYGFRANIQFSPPGSSEIIVFSQDGFFLRGRIGDPITVLYNIHNPAGTRAERADALWGDTIALTLAGAFLFILGLKLRSDRNL